MSTNEFERIRRRLTWRIHRLSAHPGTSAAIALATLLPPGVVHAARWRTTVRDRCKDAACLESVYVARLAAMRKNWAQALDPADR
ncbi:hypothetical protein CAL28_21900 [Bordetella genomosp. 11]|uniref:Uncharacterized protein n=2 Tax=Bordetella genomosp. 11 TaxID=1416808 RepID=A0A261UK29_9BORD|nr:hypothetical protein CAL28_21900 [Bordetella genomosp. 11]